MQVDGLPQRCAKVSALSDDLVRMLCTASVPNPVGGLANVFKRLWLGMWRGETSADQTSQPTTLVSPLVASTSTG